MVVSAGSSGPTDVELVRQGLRLATRRVGNGALPRFRDEQLRRLVALGVLLGDEVGDRGVQVQRGGGDKRSEEIVGDYCAVIRFADGGDLFAVRYATGKRHVGAQVLRTIASNIRLVGSLTGRRASAAA